MPRPGSGPLLALVNAWFLPTALVAALILLPPAHAQPGMVRGNIRAVKVQGTAWQINSNGQKERLREGAFLRQGSSVETASDANVILLFENGSTMNIRPGTRFTIAEFLINPFDPAQVDYEKIKSEPSKSVTQVSVQEGTILSDVRRLNRSSAYNIATPHGTAGIRGTTVGTAVNPKSSTFYVSSGSLQVRRGASTYWIGAGSPGVDGDQSGDVRTLVDGDPAQNAVTITSDPDYMMPAGLLQSLQTQTRQFQNTARGLSGPDAFDGAPMQESGEAGDGADFGGGGGDYGGGSAMGLPGFSGGGGGGTVSPSEPTPTPRPNPPAPQPDSQ